MAHGIVLLLGAVCSMGDSEGLRSDQVEAYFDQARRVRRQCAPLSVWFCLQCFQHDVSAEEVVRLTPSTEDGSTLRDMLDVFAIYDVDARPVSGNRGHLRKLPTPAILVLKGRHCLVLDRFDDSYANAFIFEPGARSYQMVPMAELAQAWSGEAIVFIRPPLSERAWIAIVVLLVLVPICSYKGGLLVKRRFCKTGAAAGSANRTH